MLASLQQSHVEGPVLTSGRRGVGASVRRGDMSRTLADTAMGNWVDNDCPRTRALGTPLALDPVLGEPATLREAQVSAIAITRRKVQSTATQRDCRATAKRLPTRMPPQDEDDFPGTSLLPA